jgi:hypothetical protein
MKVKRDMLLPARMPERSESIEPQFAKLQKLTALPKRENDLQL